MRGPIAPADALVPDFAALNPGYDCFFARTQTINIIWVTDKVIKIGRSFGLLFHLLLDGGSISSPYDSKSHFLRIVQISDNARRQRSLCAFLPSFDFRNFFEPNVSGSEANVEAFCEFLSGHRESTTLDAPARGKLLQNVRHPFRPDRPV